MRRRRIIAPKMPCAGPIRTYDNPENDAQGVSAKAKTASLNASRRETSCRRSGQETHRGTDTLSDCAALFIAASRQVSVTV